MSANTASDGGYKGDSVGKKIARVYLWLGILHRTKHLNGRYCYLASKDGGDASILAGMGIPASRQLAVDRDPKALAAFSEKYPDVPTACGNVDDVVCGLEEKFSAIYLDFCSYGTQEIFDACARSITKILPTGIFAYAAMRGREIGQSDAIKSISCAGKTAGAKLMEMNGITKEMIDKQKECATTDMINAIEKFTSRLADGRMGLLEASARRRLLQFRIHILPIASMVYHSRTTDTRGVPMAVCAFMVDYYGRGMNRMKFIKNTDAFSREIVQRYVNEIFELGPPSGPSDVGHRTNFFADLSDVTVGNLVELATLLHDYDKDFDVPKMLNTDSRQLAAWRAHYTQNRYKVSKIIMM